MKTKQVQPAQPTQLPLPQWHAQEELAGGYPVVPVTTDFTTTRVVLSILLCLDNPPEEKRPIAVAAAQTEQLLDSPIRESAIEALRRRQLVATYEAMTSRQQEAKDSIAGWE